MPRRHEPLQENFRRVTLFQSRARLVPRKYRSSVKVTLLDLPTNATVPGLN